MNVYKAGLTPGKTALVGWLRTAKKWALGHKTITVVIVVVVLGAGGWSYSKATAVSAQTRYILGSVTKGTIVSSVSASGQVSASNQLDIQAKVSGEILSVPVQPGQKVYAGQLIAVIDPSDAQKAVRDAQVNLESANISLEKLQKPAAALTLTQSQNALTNAQSALTKLYSDGNTDVVNTFLDLPDIITGIQGILTGTDVANSGGSIQNMDYYVHNIQGQSTTDDHAAVYANTAYTDYLAAKKSYDSTFAEYQRLGENPDTTSVEEILADTYTTTQLTAKAAKSANALIQLYEDAIKNRNQTPLAAASTALSNLATYTQKLNTHLSALLSDTTQLTQDKQTIAENQQSLAATIAGADPLDIQSAKLSVTKAQNALTDAQNTLANYYVRAPFAGTLAAVNAQKYQAASGVLATLITTQKIAQLSVNEVDAAKIKLGDKATLTFDAVDGLTLTGPVVQIDTVGTVTQGVVSYSIKIAFDSQDDRIKSGMTVNASIITAAHQDVLVVPSTAVKVQNGSSFVQVFTPALAQTNSTLGVVSAVPPQSVEVVTGISDDTNIEILSGITAGEQIVTRTTSGVVAAPRTTTSAARGGFSGGTGAIRL